jgi:hypothetical protein
MKGSWIMASQGQQRTVKKDGNGLWTVKYDARKDPSVENPRIFLSTLSKLSFS